MFKIAIENRFVTCLYDYDLSEGCRFAEQSNLYVEEAIKIFLNQIKSSHTTLDSLTLDSREFKIAVPSNSSRLPFVFQGDLSGVCRRVDITLLACRQEERENGRVHHIAAVFQP